MFKVGIVGSAGYAVGELYSLLINHPDVILERMYAPEHTGEMVSELHTGVYGERDMAFTDEARFDDLDVLFLCLRTGEGAHFLEAHKLPDTLKIIDFSLEHQHRFSQGETDFLYGMPEYYRGAICKAQRVAVPGCFATSVSIALLPLAKHLLLNRPLHIHSVAGKTEAAARPRTDMPASYNTLFDTFEVHKPFRHPQTKEIERFLQEVQKSFDVEFNLIPLRGNFNRGIYTTIYTECDVALETLKQLYVDYFDDHSFVYIVDKYPDVRDISNTNRALIHLSKYDGKLLIICTLDNLLKGAAGTAVHIMNLMMGLVETTGLMVKGSAF